MIFETKIGSIGLPRRSNQFLYVVSRTDTVIRTPGSRGLHKRRELSSINNACQPITDAKKLSESSESNQTFFSKKMLFRRIYLYFEVLYVLLWSCAICVNLMTIACGSRATTMCNSCDCQILIVRTKNLRMVLAHKGLLCAERLLQIENPNEKPGGWGMVSVQAKC